MNLSCDSPLPPKEFISTVFLYRVFVDVVNGEYVPRKSILKSRSRENSVCSDTSESSTAEFDDRRGILRSVSYDEATYSDNSEGILEEEEEGDQHHFPPQTSPISGTYEVRVSFIFSFFYRNNYWV